MHSDRVGLTRARQLDVVADCGQPAAATVRTGPAAQPPELAGAYRPLRGQPDLTLTGKAPDTARPDPPLGSATWLPGWPPDSRAEPGGLRPARA